MSAASDSVRESYERVPYLSGSQHHTHPEHLAALAMLHGIDAAPPDSCRVLELGCASGGNLIPMAVELPSSAFTGIDLSPRQIEIGTAEARGIGLTNLDLRAMSILDTDASLGTFDYILCHGVFSWVEPHVQEKILAVCRELLSPNGVAYISYNTYPGWHLRRMLREMLLFHTRDVADLAEKAERSFDLVQLLAETTAGADDEHSRFLRATHEHLQEYRDQPSYIVHEYLEETNAPMYFTEFAARAMSHGLQYVCEAEAHEAEPDNLGGTAQRLRNYAASDLELQQYVDFVLNRTFRRTLVCHAEVRLDRTMNPATMRRLYAASESKPLGSDPDVRSSVSESFRTERGKTFSSGHPLAKATLVALAALAPRAVSFDELLGEVQRRTGGIADAEFVLPDLLQSFFFSGVISLHALPPQCTNAVSDRPRASELARRQAAQGVLVTNQRHRVLKLDDELARFLLLQLDGSRDRHALVRVLDREAAAGRLSVIPEGQTVTDASRIPYVLEAVIEHHLRRMANLALLVE